MGREIKTDAYYAAVKEVHLSRETNIVSFDVSGLAVDRWLVGFSYFQLGCQEKRQVKTIGMQIELIEKDENSMRFSVSAQFGDPDGTKFCCDESVVGISFLALAADGAGSSESGGLVSLTGFQVSYDKKEAHPGSRYGVIVESAGGDNVPVGRCYLEDGSGNKGAGEANFANVCVSDQIIQELKENEIFFVPEFKVEIEEKDCRVRCTGMSASTTKYGILIMLIMINEPSMLACEDATRPCA